MSFSKLFTQYGTLSLEQLELQRARITGGLERFFVNFPELTQDQKKTLTENVMEILECVNSIADLLNGDRHCDAIVEKMEGKFTLMLDSFMKLVVALSDFIEKNTYRKICTGVEFHSLSQHFDFLFEEMLIQFEKVKQQQGQQQGQERQHFDLTLRYNLLVLWCFYGYQPWIKTLFEYGFYGSDEDYQFYQNKSKNGRTLLEDVLKSQENIFQQGVQAFYDGKISFDDSDILRETCNLLCVIPYLALSDPVLKMTRKPSQTFRNQVESDYWNLHCCLSEEQKSTSEIVNSTKLRLMTVLREFTDKYLEHPKLSHI
uniref:Uncharacterized protein n=1 Tax=viral metagenome TaxID=1070528 RepID=A0A6C0E6C2_9ZZZZ